VQKKTKLGEILASYMNSGKLVPDEIADQILKNRLSKPDCVERGWILDGHPRTVGNAKFMKENGIEVDMIIVLDVPDEVIIERLDGRVRDPETGKTYHTKFYPPPKEIENRLKKRADDNRDIAKKRLQAYHEYIDRVLACFEKDKIFHVNGNQKIEKVFAEIEKLIHDKV